MTPGWLAAIGLVLWGAVAGHPLIGGVLAVLLAAAGTNRLRLAVDDVFLDRSADLAILAAVAAIVGFLVVDGLPGGLLHAVGWLPAALFPLVVAALFGAANGAPLRFRHLAHLLRRRDFPEADTLVDPAAAYLVLTLLAGGALASPSPWFYWALAALALLWLFVVARPAGARAQIAFATAALAAAGLGFVLDRGLEQLHQSLQQWVIETLSGIDDDPYQSQTRIGDLGQVKLAEGIVWRVVQGKPAVVPLRLRNGVFVHFDGSAWRARRDAFAGLPEAVAGGAPGTMRLSLRGSSRQGQALLPLPLGGGDILFRQATAATRLAANSYGIVRVAEAPAHLELTLAGATRPIAAPDAGDLTLPPAFAKLIDRLPELAALRGAPEATRLGGIEAWFAEHFRYTLALGNDSARQRSLDDFLFRDRAGHCEYFASATVLLLRALGIPARYVTGYSVQEFSRLEDAFLVRQRHAHAWVEAWVDGRWTEVDTTPSTWLAAEEQTAPIWQPLADVFSFALDRFGTWRRGLGSDDLAYPAALLAAALAAIVWRSRRRLRRLTAPATTSAAAKADDPTPELVGFRELEREFAAAGFARGIAETPRSWLRRIERESAAAIGGERLATARQLVDSLYHRRYRCARSRL